MGLVCESRLNANDAQLARVLNNRGGLRQERWACVPSGVGDSRGRVCERGMSRLPIP